MYFTTVWLSLSSQTAQISVAVKTKSTSVSCFTQTHLLFSTLPSLIIWRIQCLLYWTLPVLKIVLRCDPGCSDCSHWPQAAEHRTDCVWALRGRWRDTDRWMRRRRVGVYELVLEKPSHPHDPQAYTPAYQSPTDTSDAEKQTIYTSMWLAWNYYGSQMCTQDDTCCT